MATGLICVISGAFILIMIGLISIIYYLQQNKLVEGMTTIPYVGTIHLKKATLEATNMIRVELQGNLPLIGGKRSMPENAQLYTNGAFVGNIIANVAQDKVLVVVLDKVRTPLGNNSTILYAKLKN